MSEPIDTRPTPIAAVLGIIAAALATLTLAGGGMLAALAAAFALFLLLVAATTGDTRPYGAGAGILILSLALAGLAGVTAAVAVTAAVLVVLAWALIDLAFRLGQQVGRSAATVRAELFRAGGTILAGVLGWIVVYFGYMLAPTGWPLAAVAVLMVAGLVVLLFVEGS